MPGTKETPLVVEETYRQLIRDAVKTVGGQHQAAALVGVNQATMSRVLKRGHNVSYTTLRKIADRLPGIPDPVVSIRDASHERWCKIGAALEKNRPDEFSVLLGFAERAMSDRDPPPQDGTARPSEAQIAKLKAVIASPMPKRGIRRNT